jgi:uncharacterized protein
MTCQHDPTHDATSTDAHTQTSTTEPTSSTTRRQTPASTARSDSPAMSRSRSRSTSRRSATSAVRTDAPRQARAFARRESARVRWVREQFAYAEPTASTESQPPIGVPAPAELTLLLGSSGAGKSTLLRRMRRHARAMRLRVVNLTSFELPALACVDCFPKRSLESTLRLLAQVGLADVGAWLTRADRLSDGQRFRLRLALAIDTASRCRRRCLIVGDEFGASLDRVTAILSAAALRRAVAGSSTLSALIATCHEDLTAALDPDTVVRCDFGRHDVIKRPPRQTGTTGTTSTTDDLTSPRSVRSE